MEASIKNVQLTKGSHLATASCNFFPSANREKTKNGAGICFVGKKSLSLHRQYKAIEI